MSADQLRNDAAGPGFVVGGAVIAARPLPAALHLVSTPIGNLGDITLRALETIAAADILACEDTRVTRILLERYGIRQRPVPYHEHNADEAGPRLVAAIAAGRSVALVSDAGTPLMSDPGSRLVGQVLEAGLKVIPVPGPSSILAALAASGLPCGTFLFDGFLPVKTGQRRKRLEALCATPGTLVFFESPRRLATTLADMAEVLGDARDAVVARELTKAFEEFRRGSLAELRDHYAETPPPKGEVVLCVAPPLPEAETEEDVDDLLRRLLAQMPASRAAAEAARLTGLARSDLYRRLLHLKG